MTVIKLTTTIKAPIEKVFNLSRSIDFHIKTASKTNEKVIAGRSTGLIELGETVTWKGKHFVLYLTHQSLITQYDFPKSFTDEMVSGHFNYFKHQHLFDTDHTYTYMTDILSYQVPYGKIGSLIDFLWIKKHLTQFLLHRNTLLKERAMTDT
ncbi:SRPBCC family protein [Aquimarina brevivitae]|uniref:Ligand-binding SRPBCC domain-containing protein n=1 Tax=Aquimarina brevivitae TaxID=323412 RepID=A0A4Q7PHA5_9FLAO|nr:SRPBCC family protein [Aquimarina brevivitae]RZS99914.1 ligand-binding SRPBCC domain-containing protein [Aquimarina brevivitae]